MNYEERVAFLGNWGPFQRRIFFVLCASGLPSGFTVLSAIFLLAIPTHYCNIPLNANLSQEWIQAINPSQEQSSCSRYALDLVLNASLHGLRPGLGNASGSEVVLEELPLEACRDGLNFSQQYFTSTVVTEFTLVCDDQWKQPLSSLAFFLGGLCGSFVSGQLSDRFGRKPVLFGALLLQSAFSCGMAFAPSWPVFTFLYFMVGFGQITAYIVGFVLGSELLTGGTRVLFSCLGLPFCYVLGSMLLPYAAYLLPNWRHLSFAISFVSIACVPFWWVVPESPRWLLSHGYTKEAEGILLYAASANRVQAPASIFCSEKLEKTFDAVGGSVTFWDLLKTRNIRNITLMLWLIWFSVHVSYFGLSFNMSSLVGSPFINIFLVSAIELPAFLISWLAAGRCPRRVAFMMFGSLGTLALLFIIFTKDTYPMVTLSLVLMGKFGVLAGIGGLYIHTGELYPTMIRNTAMSSCAMFSRLGSSLSPYLLGLAVLEPWLPWLLVACLSLLSVLLTCFLPETFREPMPDAIEQMAKPRSLSFRSCSTSKEKIDSKAIEVSTVTFAPEVLCSTHL